MDTNQIIAGVDEAGRGPLAGPVVAAAVIWPQAVNCEYLNDSKKLTEKRRVALYSVILKQSTAWAISMASAQEIDQINILQASLLAMRRAVLHLSIQPSLVQVDGNQTPNLPHACQAIIGGDGKIAEISAASILAKVYRDWLMQVISATYPGYEFSKHKGYGTALHLQKLKELGACIEHRASFSPVKKLLTLAHT